MSENKEVTPRERAVKILKTIDDDIAKNEKALGAARRKISRCESQHIALRAVKEACQEIVEEEP